MVTFNQIATTISRLRAHGAFIALALCAFAPHALVSKPALFTTSNGRYSVEVSAAAVEQSGNVLTTLVENDTTEKPTIPLAFTTKEDVDLFVQQLERIAALKNNSPDATDAALSEQLTPELQKLSSLAFTRLFKHVDFYGVSVLLPVLEKHLLERIYQQRTALIAEFAKKNKPSWLANLPDRARNEVLAQKLMELHSKLFFADKIYRPEREQQPDGMEVVCVRRGGGVPRK